MCWVEKGVEVRITGYCKDRKTYLNKLGFSELEIINMRNREELVEEVLVKRDREIEKQRLDGKIREAKYNKLYGEIITRIRPRYLREYRKEIDIDIVAKIRCGNFDRTNMYWLSEEDRKCRLCKKEDESLEHLIGRCEETKEGMSNLGKEGTFRWSKYANEESSLGLVKAFKKAAAKLKDKENKRGVK